MDVLPDQVSELSKSEISRNAVRIENREKGKSSLLFIDKINSRTDTFNYKTIHTRACVHPHIPDCLTRFQIHSQKCNNYLNKKINIGKLAKTFDLSTQPISVHRVTGAARRCG